MLRLAAAASSTGRGKLDPYRASRNKTVSDRSVSQLPRTSSAMSRTPAHSVAYQFFQMAIFAGESSKCQTGDTQYLEKLGTYQPIRKRMVFASPGATVIWAACRL